MSLDLPDGVLGEVPLIGHGSPVGTPIPFYEHLPDRGQTKMQADVAVMRKLLHAIYGILEHDHDFVAQKFFATKG